MLPQSGCAHSLLRAQEDQSAPVTFILRFSQLSVISPKTKEGKVAFLEGVEL